MKYKKRYSNIKIKVLLISILIIFSTLSLITEADFLVWTLPSSTMSINLTFNETPLINKNVNLTTQLLSIVNATNTTANIILPYGIELIEGNIQWNGSLIENISINLSISIKVSTTGNFTIEANARDPPSGSTYMGARETIYLEVTNSNTIVSIVPALDSAWNYTKFAINTSANPPNITFNSTIPNATIFNESFLMPLVDSPFNSKGFYIL